MPLDALREFQAAQAGHLDIGDQQVGLEPLQFAPGGLAIGRTADHLDVVFHAQQRGERATHHGLVFGKQDADHRIVRVGRWGDTLANHAREVDCPLQEWCRQVCTGKSRPHGWRSPGN